MDAFTVTIKRISEHLHITDILNYIVPPIFPEKCKVMLVNLLCIESNLAMK